MTPEEKALYQMHFFDLGDLVEIGESGTVGEVTGMQVAEGQEDHYRVLYRDASGMPHESWWRASLLEPADDDEPDMSNVVAFPCRCEREDIAASRRATMH